MYARTASVADGVASTFAIPFPYLDRSHVLATVGGAFAAITFINDGLAQITPAPARDAAVVIRRVTPRDVAMVQFSGAARLTEKDLDTSATQSLYILQEVIDDAELSGAQISDNSDEIVQIKARLDALGTGISPQLQALLDTLATKNTEQDGRLDALEAGGGSGSGSPSLAPMADDPQAWVEIGRHVGWPWRDISDTAQADKAVNPGAYDAGYNVWTAVPLEAEYKDLQVELHGGGGSGGTLHDPATGAGVALATDQSLVSGGNGAYVKHRFQKVAGATVAKLRAGFPGTPVVKGGYWVAGMGGPSYLELQDGAGAMVQRISAAGGLWGKVMGGTQYAGGTGLMGKNATMTDASGTRYATDYPLDASSWMPDALVPTGLGQPAMRMLGALTMDASYWFVGAGAPNGLGQPGGNGSAGQDSTGGGYAVNFIVGAARAPGAGGVSSLNDMQQPGLGGPGEARLYVRRDQWLAAQARIGTLAVDANANPVRSAGTLVGLDGALFNGLPAMNTMAEYEAYATSQPASNVFTGHSLRLRSYHIANQLAVDEFLGADYPGTNIVPQYVYAAGGMLRWQGEIVLPAGKVKLRVATNGATLVRVDGQALVRQERADASITVRDFDFYSPSGGPKPLFVLFLKSNPNEVRHDYLRIEYSTDNGITWQAFTGEQLAYTFVDVPVHTA